MRLKSRLLCSSVFVAALFVFATASFAAEPVPGDACTGAGNYTVSGGPELSGVGHLMVCSGSVWNSVLDFDATANSVLPYGLSFSGDISPAQITANQNNYNPSGLATASVLRLNSDASRNITGLAGGADGRILTIMNVGATNTFTLVANSGSSSAANRFGFTGNLALAPGQATMIQYDSTASRWRLIGADAGSAGAISIDNLTDAVTDYTTDHNMRLGSNTALTSGAEQNLFIGELAGAATTSAADNNIAIGYRALGANTSGDNNAAIGIDALNANTDGMHNTALGAGALTNLSVGNSNTAVGTNAMNDTATGDNNVALGDGAGDSMSSGTKYRNVFLGDSAGFGAYAADDNVMIGFHAGDTTTTGDGNILIGSGITASSASASNEMNIGGIIQGDTGSRYFTPTAGMGLPGDVTASFGASQNNYNPANLASAAVLRLTATAGSLNITGLQGGADGRVIMIVNVGTTNAFTLKDESGSSTAANRFALTADIVLAVDDAVMLIYDSTSLRRRHLR